MISDALARLFAWLEEHPPGPPRKCRRCRGTGELPGGTCPACGGDGLISSRRTQRWDPKLDGRGRVIR